MEAITVALIAAIGGVITALVQKNRKENSRDHAMVVESLSRIETKIDDHVRDHAVGRFRSKKAV